MEKSAFPRLLFVTPHAFNKVTGGGITFTNLFQGWPKAALATVHNDPEPTSSDVCQNYYTLGPAELDYAFPFKLFRRRGGAAGQGGHLQSDQAAVQHKQSAVKRLAIDFLGNSFPERVALTPALEQWIADFEPRVLYTILGSNGMMRLIEQIRRRFDLPLVVHVMDDWAESYHRHGLLAPPQRHAMEDWVAHFFDVAAVRLGISPAMCRAYEQRYGHGFLPFQNAIDTARWSHLARSDHKVTPPAEILYVGSIFPDAQLESLVDCCQAVAALSESGVAARLTIASPSGHAERYRERLAIHPAIIIEDTIREDAEFFRRIAAADLLLLPVNFTKESIRFIRYSMPTKVPAYLTVGTPILVYGPRETAQVAYAADAGWGHVVDRPGVEGLTAALRRLLDDALLREKLSKTARRVAAENHDAATVRVRFQSVLSSAARQSAEGAR